MCTLQCLARTRRGARLTWRVSQCQPCTPHRTRLAERTLGQWWVKERGLGRASWANSQAVSPPNSSLGSHRGVIPAVALSVWCCGSSIPPFYHTPCFLFLVVFASVPDAGRASHAFTRHRNRRLGSPRRAPRLRPPTRQRHLWHFQRGQARASAGKLQLLLHCRLLPLMRFLLSLLPFLFLRG